MMKSNDEGFERWGFIRKEEVRRVCVLRSKNSRKSSQREKDRGGVAEQKAELYVEIGQKAKIYVENGGRMGASTSIKAVDIHAER